MTKKQIIILAIVIFITGYLVGREFPRTGFYISLAAIVLYVVTGLKPLVQTIARRGKVAGRTKMRSFTTVLMAGMLISVLASGVTYNFLTLAIFGLDYLAESQNTESK